MPPRSPRIVDELTPTGRDRLVAQLRLGLSGENTLIPMFHLVRTALTHRARGFHVKFSGLDDETPHDLLLTRDQVEAEVACDVVTAEEGRGVHRGAWFRLADRIDPDLQIWLAAHPGRYLLKMTLPNGLRGGLSGCDPDGDTLGRLHQRITAMLQDVCPPGQRRGDCPAPRPAAVGRCAGRGCRTDLLPASRIRT